MAKALEISLTQPQADFMALDCRYPLFTGGVGSGKTYTLIRSAFIDALHSPNAVVVLYEPTYQLVRAILVPAMMSFLTEQGLVEGRHYQYNKNDHEIKFNNGQIGDLYFRSYENPALIVGYESYRSHIDELDVVSEEQAKQVWQKVIARNRQWPKDLPEAYMKYNEANERLEPVNKVSTYSTPEGYKFTYKTWGLSENPEYKHVKASTRDNPALGAEYIESLESSYPSELVKAYLDGEWVNMQSGSVYNSYDRNIHSSDEVIRPGESLFIGCDFNVRNVSATVWVKREGGAKWHAVEELTGMLDTPDMINVINARWANKGHQITMYPDASNPTHSTNSSVSDISLLKAAGFLIRAKSKNPDVRDRINATNKGFTDGRLYINYRACPTVARCLEQQSYNKNGDPDKDSGLDHQNDATTYPIAYEMMINRPLYIVPISWVS